MQATINAVKPVGGAKANAYLIFDFQNATDFKFAGVNISTNKLEIGHHTASGWIVDSSTPAQLKAAVDYVVMLTVNGSAATLTVGSISVSYTYAARIDSLGIKHLINDGLVGIGANAASATIDNVVVQAPPGMITLDKIADFSATSPAGQLFNTVTPSTGTWVTTSDGHFQATSTVLATPAVNLIGYPVSPGSTLNIATTLKTSGQGGVVFDYQGPSYFKYVTLSADGKQIVIGHRTPTAWVTDATYNTSISSGTDYKLGVSLKGGLVNVSLNGAVVKSFIYNETVTIGGYGLISIKGASSGQTSFDIIEVKTDDAAYAPPALLATAPAPANAVPTSAPTAGDLAATLHEATLRWAASGLDAATLARFDQVSIQLADLSGQLLGEDSGDTIFIDRDAAGYGWFIDHSLNDDSEFSLTGSDLVAGTGPAAGHMDLLTVVAHELGHVAGLDHSDSGLMSDHLADSTRKIGAISNLDIRVDAPYSVLAGDVSLLNNGMTAPAWNMGESGSPVINWGTDFNAKGDWIKPVKAEKTPTWLGDFINHLTQSEAQRNPNASLKLQVPVSSKVLPALNALTPRV